MAEEAEERSRRKGGLAELVSYAYEEDVFGAFDRCSAHIAEESFLIEPEPVMMRTLATVVMYLTAFDPGMDAEAWFSKRMHSACWSVVEDDARALEEAERSGTPSTCDEPRFWWVIRTLGLPPEKAHEACVQINMHPRPNRRILMDLFKRGRSLDEAVRDFEGPQHLALPYLKSLLETIGVAPSMIPEGPSISDLYAPRGSEPSDEEVSR